MKKAALPGGKIEPDRKRRKTDGIIPPPFEDRLIILSEMFPQLYYGELAILLEMMVGWLCEMCFTDNH